jgi:hypothetical protein
MELNQIDVDYAADMDLVPDDFNVFTSFSITFTDVAALAHRSAGTHRDRLIPDACATVTAAGAFTKQEGFNAVALIAAGRYRFTLSNAMKSAADYMALAWPSSIAGSAGHFASETERFGFAKTTTQFEVEVFTQAGAATSRDFVVEVFGPRAGEI